MEATAKATTASFRRGYDSPLGGAIVPVPSPKWREDRAHRSTYLPSAMIDFRHLRAPQSGAEGPRQ
jgi:hypothetical protein